MSSIRERRKKSGQIIYCAQVRVANYPTRTKSFTILSKAEKWATVEEAKIIEGRAFRNAEAHRRKLSDAVEQYTTEKLPHLKSKNMHRSALRWWGDKLGAMKLADIDAPTIVRYRAALLREKYRRANPKSKRTSLAEGETAREFTRTSATANRFVAVLSSLFTAAKREWHWVHHNPCEEIEPLPERPDRARVLTPIERKALLTETAKNPTLHLFTSMALHTACRAGELLKLEWRDVDLAAGQVVFRDTKNGQARSAWLHGGVKKLVASHATTMPHEPDDLVFRNVSNRGAKYNYDELFSTACQAAGIGHFVFHNLRHTAATMLAQQGASEQQLKAVGGWKSGVVSKYVHIAAADTRAITKTLSESL